TGASHLENGVFDAAVEGDEDPPENMAETLSQKRDAVGGQERPAGIALAVDDAGALACRGPSEGTHDDVATDGGFDVVEETTLDGRREREPVHHGLGEAFTEAQGLGDLVADRTGNDADVLEGHAQPV